MSHDMDKKGGLLGNIIVIVAVFLVGTFFGWTILGNVFGDDVEKLSPASINFDDLNEEELVSLCFNYKEHICDGTAVVEVENDVDEEEIVLTSYNETNSS